MPHNEEVGRLANPKLFVALFKLYVILVEVTRSQWVKFGARKNPEAGPYFGYVLILAMSSWARFSSYLWFSH